MSTKSFELVPVLLESALPVWISCPAQKNTTIENHSIASVHLNQETPTGNGLTPAYFHEDRIDHGGGYSHENGVCDEKITTIEYEIEYLTPPPDFWRGHDPAPGGFLGGFLATP